MVLAGRIKTVRRQHLALTQQELAVELGVSVGTVSKWERAVAEPELRYLRELSHLAGIPVTWFFQEQDGKAA